MTARLFNRFVGGLLDRAVLVCAAIVGGLIPGFIAQYRQRLGGRLDQALLDLAPWQKLADQYQGGSLELLIRHHLGSADPQFHAEGAVIRALMITVQQLQAAVHAMHASLPRQASWLLLHGDPALLRATWSDWVPTFALSSQGLVFALVFAVGVWLLYKGAAWLVMRLLAGRSAIPEPA
ncbi:MAG: DUF2937 family protein [Proteobacteria bacterium]|nr:DUF2937 family protein [Pseudomonadota bacterium]